MINIFSSIFGTTNDREVKKYRKKAEVITELESKYQAMSDEELQASFTELKTAVQNDEKNLDEVLNDSFAITREASKRTLNMRHYDVQLVGGMVLNDSRIAEMKTGEGKTLVAILPAYLNSLSGLGVHVVTVNDYLAKRDSEWVGQVPKFLGLSVGLVQEGMTQQQRKDNYSKDITLTRVSK